MNNQSANQRRAGGFTLVELLIVIGIIVLLISILIPVVSRVRVAGQNAAAEAFIVQLGRAIEGYQGDFRAYPGPISNTEIYNPNGAVPTSSNLFLNMLPDPTDPAVALEYEFTGWDVKKITMPENLVLGLLGGLKYDSTQSKLFYNPRLIGDGPFSLNTSGPSKRYKAYMEPVNLYWRTDETSKKKTGQFLDEAGKADDSHIPEFVDPYPDPLPILYLRAKRGASVTGTLDYNNNVIVTYDDSNHNNRQGQYDLHQILAYTGSKIGTGRKQITYVGWGAATPTHGLFADASAKVDVKSSIQDGLSSTSGAQYRYPFDAYAYFRNQSLSTPKESDPAYAMGVIANRNDVPRQKDGFILISAGQDRIYGTRDDITNFGPVVP